MTNFAIIHQFFLFFRSGKRFQASEMRVIDSSHKVRIVIFEKNFGSKNMKKTPKFRFFIHPVNNVLKDHKLDKTTKHTSLNFGRIKNIQNFPSLLGNLEGSQQKRCHDGIEKPRAYCSEVFKQL